MAHQAVDWIIPLGFLLQFVVGGAEVGQCLTESKKHSFKNVSAQECQNPTNLTCHTWFFSNGTGCECGNDPLGAVRCDPASNTTSLLTCYCITHDTSTRNTVVGRCVYGCFSNTSYKKEDPLFRMLPTNVFDLTDTVCGQPFNRRGQLCGQCKKGYFQPVYSYNLHCVKCTIDTYNWALYILVAFGPLTVFFIIIISCRVSVTSAPMNAFIQVSQAISQPSLLRVIFAIILAGSKPLSPPLNAVHVLATIYGIWNLDFFRTLLPNICLHVTTLQALALDLVIGVYPLALIVSTYILIELHARNFRLIVWAWKPFHGCFARFRRHWDVKTSIIDAFASFLLLSYLRLLNVSFDMLFPVYLHTRTVNGSIVNTWHLFYDASIVYFGEEHLPYAIIAIIILLFTILPMILLLLYPCRCFQRCLTRYGLRSHALNTFMDAFQGCYKDGTNGTYDCRYFAAGYLLLRISGFEVYAIAQSAFFWPLAIAILVITVVLIATIQPYKSQAYNIMLLLTLALFYCFAWSNSTADYQAHELLKLSFVLTLVFAAIPFLYIAGFSLYWLSARKQLPQRILQKLYTWLHVKRCTDLDGSLPDKLVHPQEYEALLSDPRNYGSRQAEHIYSDTY